VTNIHAGPPATIGTEYVFSLALQSLIGLFACLFV
jgi:hypothetical protein